MRLVLLGPPGVGKGTQGRLLSADKGWALISTGEMLREAAARGTTLGREAALTMARGQLVSDDVMVGLVRERTTEPDAEQGFVLDGFPRTVPQADALDAMMKERGHRLDGAVLLLAPEEELVARLSRRWQCPVRGRRTASTVTTIRTPRWCSARTTRRRRCGSGSRCTAARPRRSWITTGAAAG